jgi:hypothetical protein
MAAKCRCGERIEWRHINGRRTAYDVSDGWVHDCPNALDEPPPELPAERSTEHGSWRGRTGVSYTEFSPREALNMLQEHRADYGKRRDGKAAGTYTERPAQDEAVINSRDYDQWVSLLASELGVRERDLAYTVAYRAACEGAPTTRHTAA